MKKNILVVLAILVLLLFSACGETSISETTTESSTTESSTTESSTTESSTTESSTTTDSTTSETTTEVLPKERYRIEKENGQTYIVIQNPELYKVDETFFGGITLSFESMEELLLKIKNDGLSNSDLTIVNMWPKDEIGRIKIFDIDNVNFPIVPDSVSIVSVGWAADFYSYTLSDEVYGGFGNMYFFSNESYDKRYDEFIDNLNAHRQSELLLKTTYNEEKNATEYHFPEEQRYVFYQFDKEGTSYSVSEEYWSGNILGQKKDPLVPVRVKLFFEGNERRGEVFFADFVENPPYEWYRQFGIIAYKK